MKFKKADGMFAVERFKAAVRVFITAQEIIVDNASYPIKEIAENSHIFRTLGLGYANLGSLVMSYGYGYDSLEGRALCGAVTAIMTGEAYEQRARMAQALGPFPGYKDARCTGVPKPVANNNLAPMLEVIDLHRCAVNEIPDIEEFAYLKKEAGKTWKRAADLGKRHGYRNAQVTVLAPTGTISFLMDCDTTGIEPDIALVKYKLLAGGGLPETATVDDIMNSYAEGWRLGLKSIAIYREGSKRSAPLNKRKTRDMGGTTEDVDVALDITIDREDFQKRILELEDELTMLRGKIDKPLRHRMPDTRMSLTHRFEIAGHEGYITVGLYEDGQPGELFITMSKEGSTIGGLMDTVGTLTSIALQYGVPLESLAKKFAYQRFEPSGFTKNPDIRHATSITDYVFRWLACQFIKGYKEAT